MAASHDRVLQVLVIDDDAEDAEFVADLLEDVEGWSAAVTFARSYDEGLVRIRERSIDVCLIDYRLGARTGIEFLREEVVRRTGVPVILITGMGSREVDEEALEAGAADYLPKKDLRTASLDRAIRFAVERRRRQRAEARFRALVANSREILAILEPDLTIRYATPSVRRVLGHDPAADVGKDVTQWTHPEDRAAVVAELRRVAREPGYVASMERRVRHSDGQWRVLETRVENYLGDADIRGIVMRSWDATERVRQEERIRFQATLLGAVGQAVIATDMEGHVTYWNPAAEVLYGWTAEEVLGRPIHEITVAGSSLESAEEIMAALREGGTWSGEFRVARKDGSTFLALVTDAPILDDAGRQVGIVGVSSDISHLKRTERDLRERVKEIGVLYRAARILNRHDVAVRERLRQFVEVIPSGCMYPDVTEARIVFGGEAVATPGFRATPWMLGADIVTDDRRGGRLDVALTEGRPEEDVGPFLKEEEDLVHTLAGIVGETLARGRLARLHTLTVASLSEAVFIIDSRGDGRLIGDVNPAAERIFGYTRDELVGGTTERIHVDREAFERFGREGNPILEAGGVFRATYPLRRKDGTVFEAEQTVTLLDPGQGLAGGAVSVVRDVSEQRRAEAEAVRTEERFRVLSEEITDTINIVDAQGTILYSNSSASLEAMTGYKRQDLEGGSAFDFVHPDDREKVARVLHDVASTPGGIMRVEYRAVTKAGEVLHVESVARDLSRHPGVGGIVVTTRDVTERVRLEEHLRQSQKLEAVGRLAGGIAHDFNNLLTVIQAEADLLLMDIADDPRAEDVGHIRAAADRAAKLTSQLLAFSREQVLLPRLVDLNELTRSMGHLLERLLGEDIGIEYDLDEAMPAVEVDPVQLEQVILNLAVNARDAMPEGGRLTLSTGEEEISAADAQRLPGLTPGRCVLLAVADTGAGMSDEVKARIFEPFFTTKERGKGTGLGLAMAYGVMKQSGGSIHVESAPGQGTVFRLRFPVAEGEAEPLPGDTEPGWVHGDIPPGVAILVEDDDSVRRVSEKILTRVGLEVHSVSAAEEALDLLDRLDRVDIVLTDLVLPGMSGRKLVDRLRQRPDGVPVLVMSGYSADSPGHPAALPREATFLQKPFTPEELVTAVRSVLART